MKTNSKHSLNAACAILMAAAILLSGCNADTVDPVPVAPPTPAQTAAATPSEDFFQGAEAVVLIYTGNTLYAAEPLGEERTIAVDQGNGMVNDVHIDARGAYMEHSTCSNQDCVQQGEVTLDNVDTRILAEWIVCLPNQVTIQMVLKDQ